MTNDNFLPPAQRVFFRPCRGKAGHLWLPGSPLVLVSIVGSLAGRLLRVSSVAAGDLAAGGLWCLAPTPTNTAYTTLMYHTVLPRSVVACVLFVFLPSIFRSRLRGNEYLADSSRAAGMPGIGLCGTRPLLLPAGGPPVLTLVTHRCPAVLRRPVALAKFPVAAQAPAPAA